MEVTIENYTNHCLKTWGGENQKERAELGIMGELGEVAEVLKKHPRGDFDEIERDKRLLKELGDLLYYIAIDMHLFDIPFKEWFDIHIHEKPRTFLQLFNAVNIYANSDDDTQAVSENFILFIEQYGFTIEQVMQANIEKLAKRAKNNLIQGDGSDR